MGVMLSLEEAQERLLKLAPTMPSEHIATHNASGRYLSDDIAAKRTQPASDLSAMDGYAICGDGPWRQVGESRAGSPFAGVISTGECTRISTGAHLPKGADRVLIQENAVHDGGKVQLLGGEKLPDLGQHIRKAGFDFALGEALLTKGTLIGPQHIALALSAGHATLPVAKTPSIAVLDSGDELVRLPAETGAHQIPASNGPMLQAMIAPLVGQSVALGPVPDDLDALSDALAMANDCDVLITSGGASVGDHDLIQQALRDWGADIAFWQVAIKPGKPLMVAIRKINNRSQVILGLPGNPVSSFVTCFLIALPLIRAAMGDPSPVAKAEPMPSGADLPATGSRREFLRGAIERGQILPAGSQDSSALMALAGSNGLIDRPAHSPSVSAGSPVPVFRLGNGAISGILQS